MSVRTARKALILISILAILCPLASFAWYQAGTQAPAGVIEIVR